MVGAVALAGILLIWGLVSGRLSRYSITLPIVLVCVGALLAAGSDPIVAVGVPAEVVLTVVEMALAILLFADATEVSARWLRASGGLPLRLLGIGFPLTVAAGFGAGALLFVGADLWIVALLAAALAATDAALAAPVIADERVPRRLRRIVDVESGLNDGLATPLVLFFLAAAVTTSGDPGAGAPVVQAVVELALGLGVGLAAGAGAARLLVLARRAGWSSTAGERISVLAIPVFTFLITTSIGGNGFVAAFVAGIAAGSMSRQVAEESLQLTSDTGTVLASSVWFVFGTLIPPTIGRGISWQVVCYALLSLSLLRMAPVALALIGTGMSRRDTLFVGWIGPRGLASILFGLIAMEELREHGASGSADLVAEVLVVTVSLSVLLHGLTAGPIATRWPAPAPAGPSGRPAVPEGTAGPPGRPTREG